ncbi:MAG: hypothetical protein ABSC06_11170 [Rhodopila sp.]|jgi:hypothetical protein
MDDDTRVHLEAMEARLMTGMNDNQEKLLERMRISETAVSALTEVARGTNNTLAAITALLSTIASAQTDLGRRVNDLERKA